jgi:acetylornithine deacetylase
MAKEMHIPKVDELLKSTVSYDTVNSAISGQHAPEAKLLSYLEDLAGGFGFETRRLAVPDQSDNLLILHRQSNELPWVLFDSHLDTVSIEGMTVEPFAGLEKDGRLWGRGTCDTKGSGAAMLTALCEYAGFGAESDDPQSAHPNNIALLFSVDEEWGMSGIRTFVRTHYPDLGFSVKGAIVGEPTKLETVVAHNGAVRYTVQAHGIAAHSCNPPLGKSAISDMARLIVYLEDEFIPTCSNSHALTGEAQCSINVIRGGTASNIIPETCEIHVDRRTVPGETTKQATEEFTRAIDEFKKRFPKSDISWQSSVDLPPLDDSGNKAFITAVLGAMTGVVPNGEGTGVAYGTHAGDLSSAGIPAVVIGPGDIAQAHTKDEWIDLSELRKSVGVYKRLMTEL